MDEANDCKTENAGAGGVKVWSLERYELEKRTKLLIKLPEVVRQYVIKLLEE